MRFAFGGAVTVLAGLVAKRYGPEIGGHDDLGKQFREELEEFFVNYHKLSGEEYRVISVKGPSAARKCIENGRQAVRTK